MDLRQAYDSVHRKSLWRIIPKNIPTKLDTMQPKLAANTNKTRTTSEALLGRQLLLCKSRKRKHRQKFLEESRLRQGCSIAPSLFNLALEYVMRNTPVGGGLGEWRCDRLEFADDVDIMGESFPQLSPTASIFRKNAEMVDLQVNIEKKLMKAARCWIVRHESGGSGQIYISEFGADWGSGGWGRNNGKDSSWYPMFMVDK